MYGGELLKITLNLDIGTVGVVNGVLVVLMAPLVDGTVEPALGVSVAIELADATFQLQKRIEALTKLRLPVAGVVDPHEFFVPYEREVF